VHYNQPRAAHTAADSPQVCASSEQTFPAQQAHALPQPPAAATTQPPPLPFVSAAPRVLQFFSKKSAKNKLIFNTVSKVRFKNKALNTVAIVG